MATSWTRARGITSAPGAAIADGGHEPRRTTDDGNTFEYRMVIRTTNERNHASLANALLRLPRVRSFRISPTGD